MKHHKYLVVFFLLLITIPVIAYAKVNVLKRPIGGRVISSTPTAAIACAAGAGPIFITSIQGNPGPYFIRATTRGVPRAGGFILGAYSSIPDEGTCYNPETGAPITAYELKPYGVSR